MKLMILFLWMPLLLSGEISWKAQIEQPFAISIEISPDEAPLGSLVQLHAEFQYPASYQLDINALIEQLAWTLNPLSPQLNLYASSVTTLPSDPEVIAKKLQATIRPLSEGNLTLSFMNVSFKPADSTQKTMEVQTPAFSIRVLPEEKKESLAYAPLIPLKPEFPLGLTEANLRFLRDNPNRRKMEKLRLQQAIDQHLFPWLTLSFLIGIGGVGWTIYLMRDRLPAWKVKKAPIVSMMQKAEMSFLKLREQDFLTRNFPQMQASGLSKILLEALEDCSGQKFKELTTQEVSDKFSEEVYFDSTDKKEIVILLKEMDQIKFAKKDLSKENSKRLEDRIQTLIAKIDGQKKQVLDEAFDH